MRKRKLFVWLLLMCLCLSACGKEPAGDLVNADIGSDGAQITKAPEPTKVPDSEVTRLMIESLFDTGMSEVDSAISAEKIEPSAMICATDLYLPASLTNGIISNIQLQTDSYVSADREIKTAVSVHINGEEALTLDVYLDKDFNLVLSAPKYTTECLRLPMTITDTNSGTEVSLSGLNGDIFTEVTNTIKKGVIGALKFEKVEQDYIIGKADKSVKGLAYISNLNVVELQNSLVEAINILRDAGLPIQITSIDDTAQDIKFVYVKSGNEYGIELLNPNGTESIGFVSCAAGVAVYSYDEYTEEYTEVFRYDTLGDKKGVFYLYFGETEISGEISYSDDGFEIVDLLLGDSGIVIDSVEYNNNKFSVYYSGGMDEASLTIGLNLEKDKGSIGVHMGNGDEVLKLDTRYNTTEYKEFSIPVVTTEDMEEFLYTILESNDVLIKYFVGDDYYYDTEYELE